MLGLRSLRSITASSSQQYLKSQISCNYINSMLSSQSLNCIGLRECIQFRKIASSPQCCSPLADGENIIKDAKSEGTTETSDIDKSALVKSKAPEKLHYDPEYPRRINPYDPKLIDCLLKEMKDDMPLPDMLDPFQREHPKCFLCKKNVQLDHKNVRLLSQFVSPYTGRIYGRAVTGLCIPMQKQVAKYIKRARMTGYMPIVMKDPRYLRDPQPYDPMMNKKPIY